MNMRDEDPPPVLGKWRNLYLLVIGELVAVILLLWLLGWWAS